MVHPGNCEKRVNLWDRDVMNAVENGQLTHSATDEIDLIGLLNQLWANKWLIIFITSITLSLGILYIWRQAPVYKSNVLLQMESSRSMQGGFAADFSNAMVGGAGSNSTAAQVALIRSRFILSPVVQMLGLDIKVSPTKRSIWERLNPQLLSKKTVSIQSFEVPQSRLNQLFQIVIDKPNHVQLLDKKGHVLAQGEVGSAVTDSEQSIQLNVKGIHAPVGSRFNLIKQSQTIVIHSLIDHLSVDELGAKKNQNTGVFDVSLQGTNPKQIILTLNTIAQIAKEKDAEKKSQEASQTLSFLYKQLPITEGQLEQAERQLNRYRAKSGKIDIKLQMQFLLNQLAELDHKLNELHINKLDMLQRYTEKHPALIALDTQTKALDVQRHKLETFLKTLPASDQIAVNLLRDVKVKKALYLILLNKIQELQVIQAGTVSGIRILAKAKMPDAPLSNRSILVYLGSVIIGLVLSSVIIFGRRLLFPRVEDPHWCERQFNLASLAIIPYCKEQAELAATLDGTKQLPLLAHRHPRSLSIESLRSLRTSLQVSMASAENNIVAIMGVSPAVGKSFISANLAYLLASAGKRVLMIDADLRRGTLHKYADIPCSPGLADVLNLTVAVDDAVSVCMTNNLFCLPRGAYPTDPSELLMGTHFNELIQSLSQRFDVIVIDTAPVLLVTDAVIVGGISGTNYIVFGAGAHQPAEIELALKRLMGAGVHLHGSIFNFHHMHKKMSYGKYYHYNYNHYYDDAMKTTRAY